MPPTDPAAAYLAGLARACPHCGSPYLRRVVGSLDLRRFTPADLPALVVPCYCAGCGGGWRETYRLEAVELTPVEEMK